MHERRALDSRRKEAPECIKQWDRCSELWKLIYILIIAGSTLFSLQVGQAFNVTRTDQKSHHFELICQLSQSERCQRT